MAHRSNDVPVVVRSVCSPLTEDGQKSTLQTNEDDTSAADNDDDVDLPQCKIKRNYSCNLCPFFSQNPRSFLYHSRDVHFDRIKIYECAQCLYASKHSQKLQRHVNMIHVAGKNRIKKVNKVVKIEKKKEFKPIKPKPPEVVPVEEKKVEEVVPVLPDVKIEEEMIVPDEDLVDGELKCSVCNFTSKRHTLMRRHERVVHLKKRFLRCSKCSYVTHVKARYTKHVKYHSMPMIKCDLCDFRTPYKWNLDRHYKNHCGTGAFQCSKCNFRADIKQSLTVHEMNHHVPPVGQGAIMARKKNKVGASETTALESDNIDKEELELLRMEREDAEPGENEEASAKPKEPESETTQPENPTPQKEEPQPPPPKKPAQQQLRNVKVPYNNKRESANNNNMQTDFIHPDDIVPRYGQIYVKNLKCKFCSYKAVFSHEIWRHEKRIHGYIRPENKKEKLPKRPPPKLIPIQNKASPTPPKSPILKIPAVKNKNVRPTPESSPTSDKSMNEKEFNEMCKKSSLTSSLKDFVSLIGDEDGLKTIPDPQEDGNDDEGKNEEGNEEVKGEEMKKQTDALKKKNASFFDKLKEKLLTGANDENLICEACGHESKCLSEAVAHQKRHKGEQIENDIVLSGAELSSTRCQHCRQRCKTSTDLINHLKSCKAFGAAYDQQIKIEEPERTDEASIEDEEDEEGKVEENNSMENRVFVWNELPTIHDDDDEMDEDGDLDLRMDESYQMDTTIYGTVTSKGSDNTESGTLVAEIDPRLSLTVKKVFKCPHCSFWASTASRFHVHIVGHLNKKPFECSLCLYRSNWRWDITKHIRLKSARDPSHLEAQVNMTDETGRRNYSKYNKYLTMMKVQEPTAESSGTGRRSRACDATQGTVNEKDIIQPLPAPPRLTRAPTPGTAYQIPQGTPLRPPPPLKAAHQISGNQVQGGQGDGVKRVNRDSTKKTLWKCKKCNYRDSEKERVLAHVKEHYGKKMGKGSRQNQPASDEIEGEAKNVQDSSLSKTPPYRCGHCHQVSNWKHVIQRHCRLKHNGDVQIQVGWKDEDKDGVASILEPAISLDIPGESPLGDSQDLISCDICPFTTDTEGDLTAHKLNHVDRPGSIFKCTYCPFYVPSKIAVLEHMEVHGVERTDDLASLKVDNFDPGECNDEFLVKNELNGTTEVTKRYKCRQCPYVSNSKTQFLYHKQFHRPRDAPFKCMYCSYNVSRRHLLHQHLRVHHKHNESNNPELREDPSEASNPISDINTIDMPEIPLVWVFKSNTFWKMYKCRWCPHVNLRKINIQEHEKMHRTDVNRKGNTDSSTLPTFKLQCPDCNYMCNNAGVLSSHAKVHQGFYGEIRSLVDPTRSDAEQIQLLQSTNDRVCEPEVVIKVEADSEPEEGNNQINDEENLSSQPENAYNHSNQSFDNDKKLLSFCNKCPARFFFKKELRIHSKFHLIRLPFRCLYCTYTARQRPHLLAHYKVHSQEYQQRTATLVDSYMVSPDAPQPKTAMITKESHVIEGPVWMVVSQENLIGKPIKKQETGKPVAKHACHRCPAKFFKTVALQYHLTLHGGSHQHKCKYCDYTVKTYGNLIKHQLVHEDGQKVKTQKNKLKSVPISGTELFQQRAEAQLQNEGFKIRSPEPVKRKTDPQFGNLMHGSPEFIYPTYLKNGKIKEKRYKCHKCPSAFEKRDQYRIHLSLHGSKQKYRCEKCDYSVKYYANYVQHMRKHQSHDEALEARKIELTSPEIKMEMAEIPQIPIEERKPQYELTLLEQQTLLLLEKKKFEKDDDRKSFWCAYCPYSSYRRDAVDSHSRRHFSVSGIKSTFECIHCDYTATQANFLREHNKLHFNKACKHKAEAYLKCEKMELYCVEEKSKEDPNRSNEKILIFQDLGENVEERFQPVIDIPIDDEEEPFKLYVNPETGEPINGDKIEQDDVPYDEDEESSIKNEDLIEMIEEQFEEVPEIDPKPKVKRWRGKNWKCKKCPHAFGKRDQFLRHISLHGSNQRHNCDICDYSVKFYTNYVQHMRMHQMYEPDKVIFVKKNAQSLEESAMKLAKEELTPNVESMVVEEHYTDPDSSNLSDNTEVSISSEEVQGHDVSENLNIEMVDDINPESKVSSVAA